MIIDKLREYKEFTSQEETVAKFIINNSREVLHMNIQELAISSYTSTSTIFRMCKKIGLDGFIEFKYNFTLEYEKMNEIDKDINDIPYNKRTTISEIIELVPLIYFKAIDRTNRLTDRQTLIRCINEILRCEFIGIYGLGLNFTLAQLYQTKFEEVGKTCIAYNTPIWHSLAKLKAENTKLFVILITWSGENPTILSTAKRMKVLGIPTLLLTGKENKKLSSLCTETITMFSSTNALYQHNMINTISIQSILDIFVSAVFVKNYEKMEKYEVFNDNVVISMNKLK